MVILRATHLAGEEMAGARTEKRKKKKGSDKKQARIGRSTTDVSHRPPISPCSATPPEATGYIPELGSGSIPPPPSGHRRQRFISGRDMPHERVEREVKRYLVLKRRAPPGRGALCRVSPTKQPKTKDLFFCDCFAWCVQCLMSLKNGLPGVSRMVCPGGR